MADIKDKIKKLLALAGSPNENEAKAALLKARELMAKHKLEEHDFESESRELVHLQCDDVKWTTDSGNVWMVEICTLLADNYCCTAAWSTKGRTHTLIVTGFDEDAELCKEACKYAIKFVLGTVKVLERKSMNSHATVCRSYAKGFVEGLQMAFEEQKEEHPEWGLVVVKPQEVMDYEKGLGNKNVKTKKVEFDPLAYLKGQNDGMNFDIQKVIGTA